MSRSLKVASTLSVIGDVIGEFVGGSEGLGYLIIIANTELRTSMSFVSPLQLVDTWIFVVWAGHFGRTRVHAVGEVAVGS